MADFWLEFGLILRIFRKILKIWTESLKKAWEVHFCTTFINFFSAFSTERSACLKIFGFKNENGELWMDTII